MPRVSVCLASGGTLDLKLYLSCYIAAPTLAPLVYEADHSTQVRLRDYVVSHVFTDLDEEEPEDEDGEYDFSFVS